jgi:putative transposase
MLQSGNGLKKYPRKILSMRKRISEFIVDETLVKVGSEYIWLGGVRSRKQTNSRTFLANKSKERNMFVAVHASYPAWSQIMETIQFLQTDGGTWYPQACEFLKLQHHIHSSLEKSLIERTIQYTKDRTENFDKYFPCRNETCKLKHVLNWMNLVVKYNNKEVICA